MERVKAGKGGRGGAQSWRNILPFMRVRQKVACMRSHHLGGDGCEGCRWWLFDLGLNAVFAGSSDEESKLASGSEVMEEDDGLSSGSTSWIDFRGCFDCSVIIPIAVVFSSLN